MTTIICSTNYLYIKLLNDDMISPGRKQSKVKTCESSPGASSVHRSPWTAHRGWAGRPCCPAIRWSASETFLAKQRKIKQKKIKRGKEKNREIDEHSSRETDLRNPPDPIANACEDGPWTQTEINQKPIHTCLHTYFHNFVNIAQWSRCQLGCSGSQNLPCSNYRRLICSCSYYMEHAKILL